MWPDLRGRLRSPPLPCALWRAAAHLVRIRSMRLITPSTFRVLVILSAALALAGPLLNSIFLPKLPIGHSELIFPESSSLFALLVLLHLVLDLATTVGLCLFWRWSRPASLFSIAWGFVLYAMCAYFVDAGIKVAVDCLSTLLTGAVLSMAYFSPIASRFERESGVPRSHPLPHA